MAYVGGLRERILNISQFISDLYFLLRYSQNWNVINTYLMINVRNLIYSACNFDNLASFGNHSEVRVRTLMTVLTRFIARGGR